MDRTTWGAVEPADRTEDEDALSDTTSLGSETGNFEVENNRQYHLVYWALIDKKGQDTMEIAHVLYRMTFGEKNFLAPIAENPRKVLDLGTGTGNWAIEFAEDRQSTEVTGTDLSPIQPNLVPRNCKFRIDDMNDKWTFSKDSLDFIHARSLHGCISDLERLYREAINCIRPSGYFEQAEVSVHFKSNDNTITRDHVLGQSGPIFIETSKRMGKSFAIIDCTKDCLEKAGFVDFTLMSSQSPMDGWDDEAQVENLGRCYRAYLLESMEGSTRLLTRFMDWDYTTVQAWLDKMKIALKDQRYRAHQEIKVVCGRKPIADVSNEAGGKEDGGVPGNVVNQVVELLRPDDCNSLSGDGRINVYLDRVTNSVADN